MYCRYLNEASDKTGLGENRPHYPTGSGFIVLAYPAVLPLLPQGVIRAPFQGQCLCCGWHGFKFVQQ